MDHRQTGEQAGGDRVPLLMGRSRAAVLLCLSLAAVMTAGCASAPAEHPPKHDSTHADVGKELKQGVEQPRVPPEVAEALLPPVQLPGGQESAPAEEEPRFDVSASNMPARAFFMSLMKGTPYNVVIHPDVAGTISLTLKNVTVDQVLGVVRDVYGYGFDRDKDLYKIYPPRLQSRIFQVSYLNVKRSGSSDISVTTGQISHGGTGTRTADATATAGTNTGGTEISGSSVSTTSEADFWSDLKSTLVSIVGNGGGRKVIVNPSAGIVIVHAYPSELRGVHKFLSEIQNIVHREVILDAKVLEVRLNDNFQSGVNWGALGKAAKNSAVTGAQAGGVFSLALDADDFNAFVELLKTQGDVKVLSTPRISTVNNQKVVIKVGTDEFFVTGVSSTAPDITLTPFFSGIALDVTPQISANGEVILHIHPSVSEVRDQTKTFTVGDKQQVLPLALSSVRESDNVIRAANGQIVMIGGLMREKTTEEVTPVPVLGHIPLLGGLFHHTRQVKTKSELIILLRPQVVSDSGDARSDSIKKSLNNDEDRGE